LNEAAAIPVDQSLNHHGSHRQLVRNIPDPVYAKVDAIIVPTARPIPYLRSAIGLAKHHGCTLMALCSKRALAAETIKLARASDVETIAIDIDQAPSGIVPDFATTALLRGGKFKRRTDVSFKRNLGLLMARMIGWERIVFLDDDIAIPDPDDLGAAVGAVGPFASVGLTIEGFPDNSVVCHAYRDAGGSQDSFIGGGALAVGMESFNSFFPNIYNEDWFFLLNDYGLRPSAITGRALQSEYDPYHNPMRARSEELGDSLAEGLFMLLDRGQALADANYIYWADFLHKRRRFIDEVMTMVDEALLPYRERARMIEALKASRGRNWVIDPQLCVDYVDAWRVDRRVWRDHINTTRRRLGVEKTLADLGLLLSCHRHPASRGP
jgi:glycosyltransferase involved in cell wall biosynthesis